MFIGRFVLTQILFERGAFTPEDTLATASVLGWYLPGILPNLLGILAVRAHVVERNLGIIFWLGVVSVLCNAALNAVLMGPMGLEGLALSTTLNMLVVPALYLLALKPYVRPDVRGWLAVGGVSVLGIATAAVVEVAFGAPDHILDPVLWGAAVVCFSLLGAGWRLTTRPAA